MRHLKKAIFTFFFSAFAFNMLFLFYAGLGDLLIFPFIAFVCFALFYLTKHDHTHHRKPVEEIEHWVRHDMLSRIFSGIEHHQWPTLIYSFIFLMWVVYLWTHLSFGPGSAMENFLSSGILYIFLMLYFFGGPYVFNYIFHHFPKKYRSYLRGDWVRGYLFLLPPTTAAYLLSPFILTGGLVTDRILGLPIFFLLYSFLFVCMVVLLMLYEVTQKLPGGKI